MHLTLETLARLVDEAPAPGEAAHLRDCLACRRELAALEEQTGALAMLAAGPAPGAWERLHRRLVEEGLVRVAPATVPRWPRSAGLRQAAGVALLLAGAAAGFALQAGGGGPARVADGARVVEAPAPGPSPAEPARSWTPPAAPAPERANGARLASHAEPAARAPTVRTLPRSVPQSGGGAALEAERAVADLLDAQAAFVAALARLAAFADPSSGNDPATRLAALERLVGLTAAALERAPADPVVNGYHLAASAERESLRREMERDARITWF
jgi:hypothetical protein